MKFAIFTPGLKRSAIGRSVKLVVRELLNSGHDATVIRSESGDLLHESAHDFAAPVINWQDRARVTQTIQGVDFTFYHMGDNFHYHEGCLEWMAPHPGIICLHDLCLTDIFLGSCQGDVNKMKAVVSQWYSDEIFSEFINTVFSQGPLDRLRSVAPMTEWACSQSIGVLAHSSWGIERVLKSCPGPVMETSLVYDATQVPNAEPPNNSTFRVVTLGHINRNKRVHEVIQAIGASESLQQNTEYWLVGPIEPDVQADVVALAKQLNVRLVVKGHVSDAEFSAAIQEADLISCLRWPTLELASASLIEAMLMEKAILVINDAHYREIPDSCVMKISHEREIEELTQAIEKMSKSPDDCRELGRRAKRYAESNFSAKAYVEAMVEIATAVASSRPRLLALNSLARIAESWGATANLLQAEEVVAPLRIFENAATRQTNPENES